MFEDTVKIQLLLNSTVNQTNHFLNGFLSDSAKITSCEYTKTKYSPPAQLILLFVSGIIQQY